MKKELIIVGGFLGAGKTTLLWRIAQVLAKRNTVSGLITNDQAAGLVDTSFLSKSGGIVQEVNGSCFCCNYPGFTNAIKNLVEKNVDAVIAEPVGSCTDLSATIMQPLKKEEGLKNMHIAPLSVAVDPAKLRAILNQENPGMHTSAAYIVRKQLEEADVILLNKSDLLDTDTLEKLKKDTEKVFTKAKVYAVSAKTGKGIEEWLDVVMHDNQTGTHLTEVDYDVYAEGEAVLGWLNATFKITGEQVAWNIFASSYLDKLKTACARKNAAIGHIKLMMEKENQYIVGNLTGGSEEISVRGEEIVSENLLLTVNARAEMSPDELEALTLECLKEQCAEQGQNPITYEIELLNCLQPGRPNPTHRYDHVVTI